MAYEAIRGSRIGNMATEPPRPVPHPAEEVADPARPRHVIDYVLTRRSVLEHIKQDALAREDVCDADPYLLRAAKHHGEQTERLCPTCQRNELTHVIYVFGDDLGYRSGSTSNTTEVVTMAYEYGHFRVYIVEVCTSCHWNHLFMSYVLGDGKPRTPPRKPRDILE